MAKLVVETREGRRLIVTHVFHGRTPEEARHNYAAHLRSDAFLRECQKKGLFQGRVPCSVTQVRRANPMKTDARKALAQAKRAGKAYAYAQLDGEHFQDYVASGVYNASLDDLPTTKKEATHIARHNYLVDLKHDMSRDLRFGDILRDAGISASYAESLGLTRDEVATAWWSGVHAAIDKKATASWLGDEILFRSRERRGEL